MSRDEVPAEVRALAEARSFVRAFLDNEVAKGLRIGWSPASADWMVQGVMLERLRASRPAAPATDAEGEKLATALADAREVLLKISAANAWWDEDVAACRADKTRELARAYFADRPAPAPQAVEEVRREAAEDERDRLYVEWSAAGLRHPVAWRSAGAMLPADRQRARAGQDGGA